MAVQLWLQSVERNSPEKLAAEAEHADENETKYFLEGPERSHYVQ